MGNRWALVAVIAVLAGLVALLVLASVPEGYACVKDGGARVYCGQQVP